jgi:adenylate kinase family enzyme
VQRIAVIGCGGAGKTTLANELGSRLGLPVLHIDGFYWRRRPDGGEVASTPEHWQRVHAGMIGGDRWVIDGMKLGVLVGVYDRINIAFVRWILSFHRTARPRILELLDACSCRVVVLHSHGEARSFVRASATP